MLVSIGLYSNYWAGMTDTFYYLRTDEYKQILNRKKIGCYQVPMVHTAVMVDLRYEQSDLLTYLPDNIDKYPGPRDDIIVFALSATLRSIPLHVCNDKYYGAVSLPLEDGHTLDHDKEILRATLLELTARSQPIVPTKFENNLLLEKPVPDKLDLDEIFMINLNRRQDRYDRMKYNLDLLGLDFKHVPAVDGKTMTSHYVDSKGIKVMIIQYKYNYYLDVL